MTKPGRAFYASPITRTQAARRLPAMVNSTGTTQGVRDAAVRQASTYEPDEKAADKEKAKQDAKKAGEIFESLKAEAILMSLPAVPEGPEARSRAGNSAGSARA